MYGVKYIDPVSLNLYTGQRLPAPTPVRRDRAVLQPEPRLRRAQRLLLQGTLCVVYFPAVGVLATMQYWSTNHHAVYAVNATLDLK